jgi:type I restriction enzyme S subunit
MSESLERSDVRTGYQVTQIGPKRFEIPYDWDVKTVPELCNQSTERFESGSHDSDTFEYIDIESVSRGHIDESKTTPIEDAPSRAKQIVREGDTLIGKVRPYLQAFAPVTKEHDGKVCSTGFAVLSARDGVSSEYITQAVLSKYFLDQMTNRMTGTSYPAVNKADFQSVQLFVPPLPEQRRIAGIISTVDEQIYQTDEIIEETEMLKEGLMQDLYRSGVEDESLSTHRVGPREIEIPTHWELRTVDDLKSVNTSKKAIRGGPPGGRIKKSDRSEEGAKLYVQENVIHNDFERRGDYLSAEKFEELQSAKLDPGDVLITRSGTIGMSEVYPNDAQRGILGSSLIRIKVDEDIIRPQYLSQFLSDSHVAQSQIKAMSHGGTRTGLNNKIVKSIQVPVPPIVEQDRISEILKTVEEKIQQEKQHRDDLKDLKRGLMQDLLTGKVRVNTD